MLSSPIHRCRSLLLALVLPVLAACGGGGDDEGNITPPIPVPGMPTPPADPPASAPSPSYPPVDPNRKTCAEKAAEAASSAGAATPVDPGRVVLPPFDVDRCRAE